MITSSKFLKVNSSTFLGFGPWLGGHDAQAHIYIKKGLKLPCVKVFEIVYKNKRYFIFEGEETR